MNNQESNKTKLKTCEFWTDDKQSCGTPATHWVRHKPGRKCFVCAEHAKEYSDICEQDDFAVQAGELKWAK